MSEYSTKEARRSGRIYLPPEDYERVERAAYWEGCDSVTEFAARVLRRHIAQREAERGHTYAKADWKKRGRPGLEEKADDV